jgi:hypothetical protein
MYQVSFIGACMLHGVQNTVKQETQKLCIHTLHPPRGEGRRACIQCDLALGGSAMSHEVQWSRAFEK